MGSTVFAHLTPLNTLGKMAFHEVALYLKKNSDPPPPFAQFVDISNKQTYDKDVACALQNKNRAGSGSPTELDTDVEDLWQHKNKIWHGSFVFDLAHRDPCLHSIWIAGKGRDRWDPLKNSDQSGKLPEFLVTPYTNQDDKCNIRGKHARFQLDKHGYLCVVRASRSTALSITVNGQDVQFNPYSMNQRSSVVQLGALSFTLEYTAYSQTPAFHQQRDDFVQKAHGTTLRTLRLTPSPALESKTIGGWTIAVPLGKGTSGKVFSATNNHGVIAVVKVVEKNKRTEQIIRKQIQVLQDLTLDARAARSRHILQLEQVIPEVSVLRSSHLPFEDIHLVLQPAVPRTLDNISETESIDRLRIFHEALLALEFLHSHSWIHRDIKPTNIGIAGCQVILLDLETAVKVPDSGVVDPSPGHFGTIPYLSPEQEMVPYGTATDVWGLGLSMFELFYGYHPLRLGNNPWRPGNEAYHLTFHSQEAMMVNKLQKDKTPVSDLFLRMLRHAYSKYNKRKRISAKEALKHRVFCALTLEDDNRNCHTNQPTPLDAAMPYESLTFKKRRTADSVHGL